MYTLDTISNTIVRSETGVIVSKSVARTINALRNAGVKLFTANDVQYIIVKANRNVTVAQVEKAIKVIAKDYASGYSRKDVVRITAMEHGYYRIGK